jgi:hypothetical protein
MTGSIGTFIDKNRINHTHELIDFSGVDKNSMLRVLAKKLSVSSYGNDYPKESIMEYDRLCDHDDAYLCECRLQFIIDFVNENKDKI